MAWYKVPGCPDYLGVNWINPVKQLAVAEVVRLAKEVYTSVEALAVFGSAVRKDCNSYSDVDLLVWKPENTRFTPPVCDEYDVLNARAIDRESDFWKEVEKEAVVVYVRDTTEKSGS